ncbi:MAG: preprotein translocase subunit SecY [Bacillota bacterium]|nr:preprotein translocase subunit SecY [Bacillota bacterium]
MSLVQTLRQSFRLADLRRRILFTVAMLVVFRLGAHIPIPGIDPTKIQQLLASGTLFGFLDVVSGGALRNLSIFAMSIIPYINASIILQLLTLVIPRLEEWSKEGVEGQRKISQWTRYGTAILGLVQATGTAVLLNREGAFLHPGFASAAVAVIGLTAGTLFLMWLGELITDQGIGNGISLLIFAGILSRLPGGVNTVYQYLHGGVANVFNVILMVVLGLAVIALVVVVQQAARRIPVQYAKRVVGRRMYGGQATHIPLRVNQAGVIPVIFAAAVLSLPATLATFFPVFSAVNNWLMGGVYPVLYALLIIGFTFFYTVIVFNPVDVADNIRKYGGFIPGIRPGRPTTDYLTRILNRVTFAGAIFLALVAVLPFFFGRLVGIPNLNFGGTALLIVVGVALESMKQIESQMLMRHYEGFLR